MSALTVSGRIPIRLEPIAGESFDSWLDAYALRLQISAIELGQALGVPDAVLRLRGAKVPPGDDLPVPALIAARACGIDPAEVRALWSSLERYDRIVARRFNYRSTFGRATSPLGFSRFCPACLDQTDGRWLSAWRLPWYLACPTHGTTLTSCCPLCAGKQRSRQLRTDRLPDFTTLCSHPVMGMTGRADGRCRNDLAQLEPGPQAPTELLALQRELGDVLDPALTDEAVEARVDRLVDVLTVARHIGLDLHALDQDRLNATSVLASPMVEALRVLADLHGPRLGELVNADPKCQIPPSWRTASPALTSVLLTHRDPLLRPLDRLRYRSMTAAGAPPNRPGPSERLRSIPLALWPDWAIRLRPAVFASKHFRITGAAALCLPRATTTLPEITAQWPQTHIKTDVTRLGRVIAHDPCATAILNAFCVLAEELDRNGSPIDYDRRRALCSQTELIGADTWAHLSRANPTAPGETFKLRVARLWLWETLTGGMAEQAPAPIGMQPQHEIPRYHHLAFHLPGETVRRLTAHARGFLDTHGCHDEPLMWSPPGDLVAIGDLPGCDPDGVDPGLVHAQLLRRMPLGDIAQQLGITLDHLRYIIRQHPLENPTRTRSGKAMRIKIAARSTPQELRDLVEAGEPILAIAQRYEVSRSTMRAHLLANGIPLPARQRRAIRIDGDWLREQYIDKQRTWRELAAETGVSPTTIGRLINEHANLSRGRGTPSHQTSLTAGHGYPQPLASAILGPGGAARVRRFQVYARTRSLNVAATRLGVRAQTLTKQLNTLEAACDGRLLERLTRDQRPQELTALGRTLLKQADRHFGVHPDAPQQLPKTLSSVLHAFRGREMLHTFVAIADARTLSHAAAARGVDPYSLVGTIRKIEVAIGVPLLIEYRPAAPLLLTAVGRRLLRQANEHSSYIQPSARRAASPPEPLRRQSASGRAAVGWNPPSRRLRAAAVHEPSSVLAPRWRRPAG